MTKPRSKHTEYEIQEFGARFTGDAPSARSAARPDNWHFHGGHFYNDEASALAKLAVMRDVYGKHRRIFRLVKREIAEWTVVS